MIQYRHICADEITRALFKDFIRRQIVVECRRRENDEWVIKDDPFIDDWTEEDYKVLISCLKNTVASGGFVCGAFYGGSLKGFVSAEPLLFGEEKKYIELSSIHVSEDMRRRGIGEELFTNAKRWAKEHDADKLYISSHSAVETQNFYKKMGCTDAQIYSKKHIDREPFDCQLECIL